MRFVVFLFAVIVVVCVCAANSKEDKKDLSSKKEDKENVKTDNKNKNDKDIEKDKNASTVVTEKTPSKTNPPITTIKHPGDDSPSESIRRCYECPMNPTCDFSQKVYVATYFCGSVHTLRLQTPIIINGDNPCVDIFGDIPDYFDVCKKKERVYVNIKNVLDTRMILDSSVVLNLNISCPRLDSEKSAMLIINFDQSCMTPSDKTLNA